MGLKNKTSDNVKSINLTTGFGQSIPKDLFSVPNFTEPQHPFAGHEEVVGGKGRKVPNHDVAVNCPATLKRTTNFLNKT